MRVTIGLTAINVSKVAIPQGFEAGGAGRFSEYQMMYASSAVMVTNFFKIRHISLMSWKTSSTLKKFVTVNFHPLTIL